MPKGQPSRGSFRAQVIRICAASGRCMNALVRELNMPIEAQGFISEAREELRRLRRENTDLLEAE